MKLKFKKPKKYKTPTQIEREKVWIQDLFDGLNRFGEQMSQRHQNVGSWVITSQQVAETPQHRVRYLDLDLTFTMDTWDEPEEPIETPAEINNEEEYIIIDNGDNGMRIPVNNLPTQGRYYGNLSTQNDQEQNGSNVQNKRTPKIKRFFQRIFSKSNK